jgi:hypothetical protein
MPYPYNGTASISGDSVLNVASTSNVAVGISANTSSDRTVAISAVNAGSGAGLVSITADDGLRIRSSVTVKPTVTTKTATATLTAAEVLGQLVVVSTAAGAAVLTLPSPSSLVAAVKGAAVGDVLRCMVIAHAHASNALTFAAAPSGVTYGTDIDNLSLVRAQRELLIRFTSVTASSEAYTVY